MRNIEWSGKLGSSSFEGKTHVLCVVFVKNLFVDVVNFYKIYQAEVFILLSMLYEVFNEFIHLEHL